MLHTPPEFVATKFPGYYWNLNTNRLYSIKIDGVLKPLKRSTPNKFNTLHLRGAKYGYRVSVKGKSRWLLDAYLESLDQSTSIIPVAEKRHPHPSKSKYLNR